LNKEDYLNYNEVKLIKAIKLLAEKSKDLDEFKEHLDKLCGKWENFYKNV